MHSLFMADRFVYDGPFWNETDESKTRIINKLSYGPTRDEISKNTFALFRCFCVYQFADWINFLHFATLIPWKEAIIFDFLRANLNKLNRPNDSVDLYNAAHFHTLIFPYDNVRWIQTLFHRLAFEFNEYRCCFYYHRFISIIYDGSQSWLDMTTIYTF